MGLWYRLTHRQVKAYHPNGYILHSEYSVFPPQVLTNLCLWDGTQWHQAPIEEWDRTDGIDYLNGWVMGIIPLDQPKGTDFTA